MTSSIAPINQTPQYNFDPNNLPPGTADFYNTAAFASNLSGFLATAVSQEQNAQEIGLQQIKDAIDGLT